MFRPNNCETGTSLPQTLPNQPQLHRGNTISRSNAPSTAANPWHSRVTVHLSGKLATAPRFQDGSGRVELVFLGDSAGCSGRPAYNAANSDAATPKYLTVWCDSWQFAKVAAHLTPQAQLEVEGRPLVITDENGQPKLGVICTSLKIAPSKPRLAWAANNTRLALCWVSIFGGIGLLQLLLPKIMPPGILPLAILLGGLRLIEGLGFVPIGVKAAVHSCLVKILILAALVIALWLFIQFSYFTTARFR